MAINDTREQYEQTLLTSLVNQGWHREDAERIAYPKPAHHSERAIKAAQKLYAPKAFSLLK